MPEGWNKYQYSQFDDIEGQYVVRTDDKDEFKQLVAQVKLATGKAFGSKSPEASQTARTASTSDSKPKVPYMYAGDTCPLCGKGKLVPTVKETREHKKYDALVCDQDGCWGKAYPSKYPKISPTGAMPLPQSSNDIVIENGDLPF